MASSSIAVICGNPRPQSRTLGAALALGKAIRARIAPDGAEPLVLDLAEMSGELLDPASERASAAVDRAVGARLLVVATPVYKGSFTGLLKVFLDRFPTGALTGSVAIPMTVSASPAHQLVADTQLRPVLIELGASTPTRAFAITEDKLPDLPPVVEGWLDAQARVLSALVQPTAGVAG